MSETIYAWLLRLFPSSFREAYGEDALQLFRDRRREEQGFFAGLRLWFDLLSDLVLSLPDWHRHKHPVLAMPRVQTATSGIPSFQSFHRELPPWNSLLYGMLAWLVFYGTVLYLLDHGRTHFAPEGHPAHQMADDTDNSPATPAGSPKAAGDPSAPMVAPLWKPMPMVSFSYTTAHPGSGSPITLKAAVYPLGAGPTPTGLVVFFDGDNALDVGRLENGIVTVKEDLLCAKTDYLKAVYYGDDNYSYGGSLPPQVKENAHHSHTAAPPAGHGCRSSVSSRHATHPAHCAGGFCEPPRQVLFMAVGP